MPEREFENAADPFMNCNYFSYFKAQCVFVTLSTAGIIPPSSSCLKPLNSLCEVDAKIYVAGTSA